MSTTIIGFPRLGEFRELKFTTEKYFRKEISADELLAAAKDLRAKHWNIVKAVSYTHLKVKNEVTKEVLEKIGADLVILPEVEAGMSLAKMILFQHRIEVFQLDDEVVVVEFTVPSAWVGKSIRELAVRDQYQLNIIGYRDAEEQPLRSQLGPDFVWPAEVRVMAVTDNQYLDRIQDLLD